MDHRIVRIVTFLGLLGLAAGQGSWAAPQAAVPQGGSHQLDGKEFYGRERVKGKEEKNQIYIFKDGTFEARSWAATGLQPGPYTARAEGDAVLFTAVTRGQDPGVSARWQGKVVGNHIEVTGVVEARPPIEVSGHADLGERTRDAMLAGQQLGPLAKAPGPGTLEGERSLQQAHQKLTMAQIRNLGTALFSWLIDQVPQPGLTATDPGGIVKLGAYPLVTAEQVRQRLVPRYLEKLDTTDGWGRPIEMRIHLKALPGAHVMCLRSPGRDGRFSGDSYTVGSFPPDDLDQDIVWCDGFFVRWPEPARRPGAGSPR